MRLEPSDLIALVGVLIAIIAMVVSIYAAKVSYDVATSEFTAVEGVKRDTARLLAALRTLMMKGAVAQGTGRPNENISFIQEKGTIEEFLNGTTGFAYFGFVSDRSEESGEGKSEEWRLFFIYLIDILNSNNIIGAATRAADLELLFTDFDEQSYRRIASFVEDLPKGYEKIIQGREHDVLLKAFLDLRVKSREGVGDRDVLLAKLRHLKEKGIDDPNIDLFISVITNDVKLLQDALQRGGDQSMTDAQLLRQYEDELRDFRVER